VKKTQLNIGDGSNGNQHLAAPPLQRAAQTVDPNELPNDCGHFVRMGDLRRLFGITRPTAYLLAKQGKIRTVSLRQPDHVRGRRLVNVLSVRAYLQELQGGQGVQRKQNTTTM
jgi:hypothetical protein